MAGEDRQIITRYWGGTQLQLDAVTESPTTMYLVAPTLDAGTKRVTRLDVMPQLTYDGLAEVASTTLYVISTGTRSAGTAHRWPLAADTATAFFLGATAVVPGGA